MKQIAYSLIFSATVISSTTVQAKSKEFLPSFRQLSEVAPETRKQYLEKLHLLIKKESFSFFDEIVISTNKKFYRKCFDGLYGNQSWTRDSHLRDRKACKQNIDQASLFFANPENRIYWQRFAVKMRLVCFKSKSCDQFLSQHKKIETALKAPHWVVKK